MLLRYTSRGPIRTALAANSAAASRCSTLRGITILSGNFALSDPRPPLAQSRCFSATVSKLEEKLDKAVEKIPKKRGRPRKADTEAAEASEASSATEAEVAPRRRGRPRKATAMEEVISASETVPKRRGRPRRGDIDALSSATASAPRGERSATLTAQPTRATSVIMDDNYGSEKTENLTPDWARLDPYALMSHSFHRQCIVTNNRMPRSFMLQLKASIVDDDGTVAVFPYQVEHPRFAAKKAGPSVWTMLRKDEVEKVSGGRGPWVRQLTKLDKDNTVPSRLPDMVDDQLGLRMCQELEVLRKAISSTPRQSVASYLRPLSPEQIDEVRAGHAPTYDDAAVIGIIDSMLRKPYPFEPSLLTDSAKSAAGLDASVPLIPLHIVPHAERAASLVLSVLALQRERSTIDEVRAAAATVEQEIQAKETKEAVSKHVAEEEMASELGGSLPEEQIVAAVEGVEEHRKDEESRLIAVVVPDERMPLERRSAAVPLAISLIRAGLYHGFGWKREGK